MFNHYKNKPKKTNVQNAQDNVFGEKSSSMSEMDIDLELEFDKFDDVGQDTRGDVEIYIVDGREKRDQNFDVLGWWKTNLNKFHRLSQVARHVLGMPTRQLHQSRRLAHMRELLIHIRTHSTSTELKF